MPTLNVVKVPEDLIERLTALAAANNRTVSEEAVAALERWVDTTEFLFNLREFREQLTLRPLTDAELHRMKNDGRA
jgi:hypothetical protein